MLSFVSKHVVEVFRTFAALEKPKLLTSSVTTLIAAVLIFSCGCYPDWPEHAGKAVVQGTITLDGSPLKNAKVVFIPDHLRGPDDTLVPLSYGTTDVDGKFELSTAKGETNVAAGQYTVMISKIEQTGNSQGNSPWTIELIPDSVRFFDSFDETGEQVPANYNFRSELTYEVMGSPKIIRAEFMLSTADAGLYGEAKVE